MKAREMTFVAMALFGAAHLLMADQTARSGQGARPTQPARAGQPARGGVSASKARLRNPAALNERAPAVFLARFDTSRGVFIIEAHRDWAPLGADRFYNLVKNGFYDDVRFFRVLSGFMAQFGMNGDPAIQKIWGDRNINDDPVKESNKRGYVTFAKTSIPNTRSTQIFINYADNSRLDADAFAPFGQVVSGMEVVDALYSGYGRNNVPDQQRITSEGNAYLQKEYPQLDFVKKATIEKAPAPAK